MVFETLKQAVDVMVQSKSGARLDGICLQIGFNQRLDSEDSPINGRN